MQWRKMSTRKILDKGIARPTKLTTAVGSVWSTKRLRQTCAGVFRGFLQLLSEAAEVFAIGSVRTATAGLVVLVGAAAVLVGSLIYFGSSFGPLSGNPQIASGSNSTSHTSVARNTEQQMKEAARQADKEQSRQRIVDAQLKNDQQASRFSDVAVLPEQDLIAVQKRYAQLFEAGDYDRALLEAQSLEAATRSSFGENDPRYAAALGALAKVHVAQGRYSDAEVLYKRMLAIRADSPGTDLADLARALADLAEVYRGKGRVTEAEELAKRASSVRGATQAR